MEEKMKGERDREKERATKKGRDVFREFIFVFWAAFGPSDLPFSRSRRHPSRLCKRQRITSKFFKSIRGFPFLFF